MKIKNLFLMLMILLSISCKDDVEDVLPTPPEEESPTDPDEEPWVEKSKFPGGYLADAVSFVIGDKLYVGSGVHDVHSVRFFEYTSQTDTWKEVAPLYDFGRVGGIAFSVGEYGYVGFGKSFSTYYNDLWRYDPKVNEWKQMASFPGIPVYDTPGFVISDKFYVLGASDEGGHLWEYNTKSDTWTKKANWPGEASSGKISFTSDGKGYLGLGFGPSGATTELWEYSPSTNSWSKKANFPGKQRIKTIGLSYQNKGLIACGMYFEYGKQSEFLTEIWKYDPITDKWTQSEATYPGKGRVAMIGGVIGSKIIMGLGASDDAHGPSDRYDDIWEFNP